MAQVTNNVERDALGNPVGASTKIINDPWEWGGVAKTTEGIVYIQNDSWFKTRIDYNTNTGILGSISKSTQVGPFEFVGGVNTNGTMTGTAEAKWGGNSLLLTPSMAQYGYKGPLGPGTFEAQMATNNSWQLKFGDTLGGFAQYSFSGGHNSSSGYFFNAYIFSLGA
jgi:hypothetical protein